MAIKKIKLPNNTTEDINDSRLPTVATTDNGKLLGVSGGIWSTVNKPGYTLDEVADGSTRKLANYLPLTGGTLSGLLLLNYANARIAFQDGSGTTLGALGVRSAGTLEFYDTTLWRTVYHSNNSNKSDVPWACSNLTATGTITHQNGTPVRKITISSSEPTSSDGSNDDIWIVV